MDEAKRAGESADLALVVERIGELGTVLECGRESNWQSAVGFVCPQSWQ